MTKDKAIEAYKHLTFERFSRFVDGAAERWFAHRELAELQYIHGGEKIEVVRCIGVLIKDEIAKEKDPNVLKFLKLALSYVELKLRRHASAPVAG